MNVQIYNKQSDMPLSKVRAKAIVRAVIGLHGHCCDEVSIYFVDVKTISALHNEFFQDPSVTDCISFPMDDGVDGDGYSILGEVFICPRVALDYSSDNGTAPYEEATLYIIHGLLHLLGLDDLTPADRKKMRAAEAKHLKNIRELDLMLCPPKKK